MTNISKFIALNAVLILLVLGGFIYISNETAQSEQALDISFTEIALQDVNPTLDLSSEPNIIVTAQNTCGSETCTADQCCCLNIDNGNQCCRPKQGDNCIESCKKSDPC